MFKNKVGRPSNDFKRRRKLFYLLLVIILISTFGVGIMMFKDFILIRGNANNIYYYTKSDTVLRTKIYQSSPIDIIIQKGTRVKYFSTKKSKRKIKENDTYRWQYTTYYYVQIEDEINGTPSNKYYKNDHKGYVLARQLSSDKVKRDKIKSLTIREKTKIAQSAYYISNMENVFYSKDTEKRNTGYLKLKYEKESLDNNYYFDCSSFISTVLYDALGKDLITSKDAIYTTTSFINSTILKNKEESKDGKNLFYSVKEIDDYNDYIRVNNLQVGDIILGLDDLSLGKTKSHKGINHMLIYVGDGYVMHSTYGYLYGNSNNELRNGIVHERLKNIYYRKLGTTNDYRFNKKLYVIRINK